MTDIAIGIDRLVPAAKYRGSLTDNTQAAFDALAWEDARPKPSWTDVVASGDAVTVEDVIAERARRLELGFDYDFGDARGIHHIGTTPEDMTGWRDVIDYANALIDTGDIITTIGIVSDTGPCQVTAPEWQAIMLAAAQVRQQIWAASFTLQTMDPIPQDYASNESYWSA